MSRDVSAQTKQSGSDGPPSKVACPVPVGAPLEHSVSLDPRDYFYPSFVSNSSLKLEQELARSDSSNHLVRVTSPLLFSASEASFSEAEIDQLSTDGLRDPSPVLDYLAFDRFPENSEKSSNTTMRHSPRRATASSGRPTRSLAKAVTEDEGPRDAGHAFIRIHGDDGRRDARIEFSCVQHSEPEAREEAFPLSGSRSDRGLHQQGRVRSEYSGCG